MENYDIYIEKLDDEIIELLSIRKKYLLNSKNFKVYELGGYNMYDSLSSNLDNKIYNIELKKDVNEKKTYEKYFNEDLYKSKDNLYKNNELENLNLNNIIKCIYINFLYDVCKYGNDEYKDEACKLDIEILYKISERIHFGYEIIKFKYIDNKDFYDNLFETKDTSLIQYYLTNSIKQPCYLDKIKEKCINYNINDILICTFYKHFILPLNVEIQLNFCKSLKQLNKS